MSQSTRRPRRVPRRARWLAQRRARPGRGDRTRRAPAVQTPSAEPAFAPGWQRVGRGADTATRCFVGIARTRNRRARVGSARSNEGGHTSGGRTGRRRSVPRDAQTERDSTVLRHPRTWAAPCSSCSQSFCHMAYDIMPPGKPQSGWAASTGRGRSTWCAGAMVGPGSRAGSGGGHRWHSLVRCPLVRRPRHRGTPVVPKFPNRLLRLWEPFSDHKPKKSPV